MHACIIPGMLLSISFEPDLSHTSILREENIMLLVINAVLHLKDLYIHNSQKVDMVCNFRNKK